MRFVKSKANEYLVVSKNGELENTGVASSRLILPGQVATFVPAKQFKTNFAMTQETNDGIALRFKGVIIYRIVNPEIAVKLFEFSDETAGTEVMSRSLADISLGELRDVISHMNMQECISQRKTTLSNAVKKGLESVASSWGINIEVAQLAQVFIYDNNIREYLETNVRNELRLESELSDIKTREELYIANEKSKLLQKEEDLKTIQMIAEMEIEEKKVNLDKKQKKMELSIPNRQEEIARYSELLKAEESFYELQESVNSKRAKCDLARTIEQIKIDEKRASFEQLPELAESLSNIFKGANLSFYNDDNDLMKNISPLIEMITSRVKK